MEKENKEIKVESIDNSTTVLSKHIDAHEEYMNVASLGARDLEEQERLSRSTKSMRKLRSLPRIIAAQKAMIRVSLSFVKMNSKRKWAKKYPTSAEKDIHPLDSDENDYKDLVIIAGILRSFEKEIRNAEWTNTLEDDFIKTVEVDKNNYEINDKVLTDKFFEMLEGLEESYVAIHDILLHNGLITSTTTQISAKRRNNEIY